MSSQNRLRDELRAAKAAAQLSGRAIAEKGGLSHGTVQNYLDGAHPRHVPDDMLERLARGFGVPFPVLKRAHLDDLGLAQREEPEPTTSSIEAAILADDTLLPEARQHLLNQVGLLRRLSAPTTDAEKFAAKAKARAKRLDDLTPAEPPAPIEGRREGRAGQAPSTSRRRGDR